MSNAAKMNRSTTSQEFTAIVLAGLGGNLSPLTNPENLPKALLPLANKALISYPLSWAERAGITSIIILCIDTHESQISAWLKTSWKSSVKPLLVAASSEDIIEGSADALRTLLSDKYHDHLKADVILLSCDTICEIPPHKLLDFHRLSNSSITTVFYRDPSPEIMTPTKKGSRTLTGYEHTSQTLLYTSSEADVEDDLSIRTSMLWKYPRVTLTTTLNDLHLYICKRWVLDTITHIPELSRINTDLLPLLCKSQYQTRLRTKYTITDSVSAKLYIPSPSDSAHHLCARINTRQAYIDITKHLLKLLPSTTATTSPSLPSPPSSEAARIPSSSTIGDRSTLGTDSILGANSHIAEKSTVKRSSIANNVTIGTTCRVSSCIIMAHATIHDGAKLENCIVCVGASVGERASLRDCVVGGRVSVPERSDVKGEDRVVGGDISMGI